MKKTRMLLSILLAFVILLSHLPTTALGAGLPQEWIAEFADSSVARSVAESEGGIYLGGPFVLLKGSRAEMEHRPILSLTGNSRVEGSGVSQPTDPKAGEQYILNHKSWYALDAWAALETFLASQSTPLTPANCATVRVAVIDSGIDATHEDLTARVVAGWDAVNGMAITAGVNSDVSADSHGTKVAGLIGAASDNGIGTVGAAWTFPVELIPVRVLNSKNKGTVADVVAAIYWAVDEGGADILNLSFGQTMRSVPSAMQTAVLHAVEQGVMVVGAAGNDGEYYKSDSYCYYPAALEGVFPVGSTARALGSSDGNYNNYVQRADFSNRPNSEYDCGKTFFYTPGEDLLTTSAGNSYEEFSGTSASAALLTGMLAALKSCADTTSQPGAENYLSSNKYSYMGSLYYQEYKAMAQALVEGDTDDEVWFAFDEYGPDTLRGTVTLSGILNDPGFRYTGIRLSIEGELVDTVARTEAARQYITFTVDTTAFADGEYYPYQIKLAGILENGTEEIVDHTYGFLIGNDSESCTVSVTSGGAPLVGAKSWLFRSGTAEEYRTNGQGEIDLSANAADGSSRLLVVGEGLLVWRSLAPYPAGNHYSFGNDPALLAICCTGEILAAVDGGVIYATMPDGARYEVGTVNGERTELWVDTDSVIDLTVCGEGAILSVTVDLSGDDVVWDLDNAGLATVTLTHDGQAPAEGTEGPVRFLGLALGGFGELRFAAEGGSILVSPGEYAVTGYVYWWDGTYYSLYAEVDLGIRQVTEEGLALVLGSGIPVASVAVSPETVIEGKKAVFTVSLSDSCGNPVTGMGCSDDLCSYREKYGNASLYVEEYDAENDMWNQIGQAYLYTVPGSISVEANVLGTRPGQRRVTFSGTDFFMGMADGVTEFAVVPQETRPAATVRISLTDLYGNTLYDLRAATVLADAEGKEIVREAYVSEYGDEAVIKLPIGESYTLAVLAVDYSTAYLTVCQADLTGAADGDEVLIALETDGSWIAHTVSRAVEDIDFCVRDLGCVPFEAFPQYVLEGDGDGNYLEALYTSGLGELDLYFDLMPDDSEADNYEYPPVFTMKKQADLWLESVLEVALPNTITLTAKAGADSAVLTPVITDSCGNVMVDVVYVSRYGGMGGDMAVSKPDMVYPVITVTDGAGRQVYSGVAPFAPVTVDGLEEGSYEAVIVWNSSDISMSGGPVPFAVGGGEPSLPASGQKAPTGFKASASGEVISLSWNAPAGGCEGYLLLRDGEELARPDGEELTYLDDTALPGSYHMYTLYALGVGDERSEPVTAGVRLGGGVDAEAPVWGNGAQLTVEVGESGMSLSWSRAQDAGSGVTGYVLLCNGEQLAQLFTRRYTVSALQADTEYIFAVQAVDGAGNLSEPLTAAPVSVSSGILSVELDYAQNRLGYMLGKTMTVRARATADLDSAAITVDYTLQDGSTGTLTPEVTGGGGLFTAVVTLPDNFVQVDRVAVSCGGDDLAYQEVPIFRCASHVEITVNLAEAAALYPSAVLSLYAPTVGYAYSWPVEHMTAFIAVDIIGASDYRLTLADGSGNVLLAQTVDLSANARINLDGEKVRFLHLTVEDGYAGLGFTLVSGGKLFSGELDEDGVAVWSGGGRFLPVGDRATLRIPELDCSEELTFDKVVNRKTVNLEALQYEPVSVTVTVLDPAGKGISGMEVRVMGAFSEETGETGADGTCTISVVKRKHVRPVVSVEQQRDGEGRIWGSCSVLSWIEKATLCPAQLYERINLRPVLDMDVPLEDVSFAVDGQPAVLQDGLLTAKASDGLWQDWDRIRVTAQYTVDGATYSGKAYVTLNPDDPKQPVGIAMKGHVDVTLALTDNGDVMPGRVRYFSVYDNDGNRVISLRTYDVEVSVSLAAGETYSVVGSWEQIPVYGSIYYSLARAEVTAEEGLRVPLSLTCGDIADILFSREFLKCGAITCEAFAHGQDSLRFQITVGEVPAENPFVSEVYHELRLPDGARDVSFSEGTGEFDPDTGVWRLTADLSALTDDARTVLYFSLPANELGPEDKVVQDLIFTYEGNEYRSNRTSLSVEQYLMVVSIPERIGRSELSASGIAAKVSLHCARTGILEMYEGDRLLAACATSERTAIYSIHIRPEATLGEHTVRIVYTAEDGLQLARTLTFEAVEAVRPELLSARTFIDGEAWDDLVDNSTFHYYLLSYSNIGCLATFSNMDKVERVWLVGETDSDFDRIELFWDPDQNGYYGFGQLGSIMHPFTALWIEFEEKTLTAEETANEVRGEVTIEPELTYTPAEIPDHPYFFAPDPDLGEEVQRQALSDWEQYVELVDGGLYETEDGEAAVEALNGLFGEDGVWHLPAVTDGEHNFSMSYSLDPETVAAKLASDTAFTVMINGEARKVLVELAYENSDLYVCYYGLGDLFIPAVPETGETTVTAAGKISETLEYLLDRYWRDGMEVKEKYDEYSWIGEGLWEELFGDDPEDGGDPGDGDPCNDGSGGKQSREERHNAVDEAFDQGWEAAKAVAEGISMTAGFYGLESSMMGDYLTQDGGPMHAMFELQKQRIHQIDDILDELDPDAFGDGEEDPCNEEEPEEKDKEKKPKRPKSAYRPAYPLIDPSGYLYAGAPGYPVEGVNAYLYYLEEDGETWKMWNSEDFGQGPNPYPSESSGYYGWDVLPGQWKVVFEGEGYAAAESIVLEVPPPHLDVDICLTSTRNPAVADAVIRADGSVDLKFDHLMTVDSVLQGTVTVMLGGEMLTGRLEAVNGAVTTLGIKQAALDTNVRAGLEVASVFRFVPDDILLTGMTVEISVDGSVLGYNGLPMLSSWSRRLTVPAQDAAMGLVSVERTREEDIYLQVGESCALGGEDWHALYTDGFAAEEERTDIRIRWYSTDESVALVDETGRITAVGGGIASVIGEYEGHTIGFGVSVTRAPIAADPEENDVKFCREQNLVLEKACYMWSAAANFRLDNPMEGDEKFLPVAWRVKEGGTVRAEGTVPEGESSLKIIYTPEVLGTLTGEIDYRKYVFISGRWTPSEEIHTAERQIPVTEVTALELNTAPGAVAVGEELDLSALKIDIHLSDGTVSTVGWGKLASYGITMNLTHGDVLGKRDGVLILSHGRTGILLKIDLGLPVMDFRWEDGICTAELLFVPEGVTVMAAGYMNGRMVEVKFLSAGDPVATLAGDEVKVFFLQEGTYIPDRRAPESQP